MIQPTLRASAVLVSLALLARFALADDQIAWTTPRTISTDADVSIYGTLFGAINNGGDGVQEVFVNNVPFSPFPTNASSQPVTHGNFTLSAPLSTVDGFNGSGPSATGISAHYQSLLGSASFTSGGSGLFLKIANLTVGQLYQVQVWADGPPGDDSRRGVTLSGSPSVKLGVNQYALGTFTATASENTFQIAPGINEYGPFTNLSAVQVRALPPGPPLQISNRGFYRGPMAGSTGGKVLLFVHGNNSIAAYVAAHNKFSSGGGRIAPDGAFSFTMTLSGSSITGKVTPGVISGSYTPPGLAPETFNADRVGASGPTSGVAGKYEGTVDGVGKFTVLIDSKGQLTLAGVNATTNATIGGGGLLSLQEGEKPALSNRAADWIPNDSEDASSPKFTGTFHSSAAGYENEIVTGSINFFRSVIEGNIGGKFRGTRQSAPTHLANISTRGTVTNEARGQVIGGFIIQNGPKLVMIRALGPSLLNAGIPEALADPRVQLYSGQTLVGENDDWQSNSNAAEITATTIPPPHGKEAALLVPLEPGAYTAVLSGSNNGTGVALIEVYEIIRD